VSAVARRMKGYVYEVGGDIYCPSSCHGKIVGSLWQVWQCQLSSLQGSISRQRSQTPRLDHAALACASRWRWTDQDSSRDSASGSQKATLRLTNEPLVAVGVSSPRHLMPSIRLHGPRTQSSYMTSRNALRHVLARTTPSPARRSPRTSRRVYSLFVSAKVRVGSISYQVAMNDHVFIEQLPRGM